MNHAEELGEIIRSDTARWQALKLVQRLGLPDCWIGAGYIRHAAWDHLHDYPSPPHRSDVDVVWFDSDQPNAERDKEFESYLTASDPRLSWSVKNQARMHTRNVDQPYSSVADAMRNWPETATAVAVRITRQGKVEINAPFGLDDLFSLQLRPTEDFRVRKRHIFEERIQKKRWLSNYPLLNLAE